MASGQNLGLQQTNFRLIFLYKNAHITTFISEIQGVITKATLHRFINAQYKAVSAV